jgi:hypothetical protein
MQRFGLVNADADDLGPFVTNTADWKPGDRIYRSSECDLIVLRAVEADASDNVDGLRRARFTPVAYCHSVMPPGGR